MAEAGPADQPLWVPSPSSREDRRMGQFLTYLDREHGKSFDTYDQLWQWSVDDLDGFWTSLWKYFDVISHSPYDRAVGDTAMPGTTWFRGATLNYAEHALRGAHTGGPDRAVVLAYSQTRATTQLRADELQDQVARARVGLQKLGVGIGDRVAGFLPNIPETLVAFLATVSLGAIWSSCAPEFGPRSVIDRLRQIEPKVLITVDGYRFGAKDVSRTSEVAEIRAALPSVEATVFIPYLSAAESDVPDSVLWAELLNEHQPLVYTAVPFDHPLCVLFSSGTTGLPKAIVHGHGGILLEHLKALALHLDLGGQDRFFWFTTTGWTMWNFLISGLVVGSAIVLFDGDPAYPDLMRLWNLVEEAQITYLGSSAPWIMACRKAHLHPATADLSTLRGLGSTGAPLPPEGFEWIYSEVAPSAADSDLLLGSISGGTDLCTAIVGGSPLVPVYSGEISCRWLGTNVEAFDADGKRVIGEQGELVVLSPLPSMPVGFWRDDDGSKYRAAYFDYYPGLWRHGDWVTFTERGSCTINGRSDATLNRGGVRLGTAEFYSVVEELDEVQDSLVVHLEDKEGSAGELLLFLSLKGDRELTADLRARIVRQLRSNLSPRHVPDVMYAVPAIPRTLTGKKLEVPVKRILTGTPADDAASTGSMADPTALEPFERLARERSGAPADGASLRAAGSPVATNPKRTVTRTGEKQ